MPTKNFNILRLQMLIKKMIREAAEQKNDEKNRKRREKAREKERQIAEGRGLKFFVILAADAAVLHNATFDNVSSMNRTGALLKRAFLNAEPTSVEMKTLRASAVSTRLQQEVEKLFSSEPRYRSLDVLTFTTMLTRVINAL